jgi:GNAT superfamily N-acetyltransferase
MIKTRDPKITIRFATVEDSALIVDYMKKLGSYQKMLDKITATKESIYKLLSEKEGEAIFAYYDDELAGFAYFFNNSSAFIGEKGIYIDGLFINDTMRGKGIGKMIMSFLSKLAIERGCKRLEWGCLDWNEPSINFYKKMGAYSVDTMTIYRFSPEKLKETADLF